MVSSLLAMSVQLVRPAAAQTPTTAAPTTTAPSPDAPPPVQDARLSAALDAVAVSSPAYERAQRTYTGDWHRLLDAQARQAAATTLLSQLAATQAGLTADLDVATRRHSQAAAEVVRIRASLRVLAIALYVQGGPDPTGVSVLDPAQSSTASTARVLVETVGHDSMRGAGAQTRRWWPPPTPRPPVT